MGPIYDEWVVFSSHEMDEREQKTWPREFVVWGFTRSVRFGSPLMLDPIRSKREGYMFIFLKPDLRPHPDRTGIEENVWIGSGFEFSFIVCDFGFEISLVIYFVTKPNC